MTALDIIAALLVAALVAEVSVWALIQSLKSSFQWLIGPRDVCPEIPESAVEAHLRRGFDPELGWRRLPGTEGRDRTDAGIAQFRIDDIGCRVNPSFDGRASQIAAFGDSFTFCRLVDDDETWPHALSRLAETNVLNFGVGNYGLDQALLLLERQLEDLESQVVIMGVVPETIARVHSYWKHYFEYGNTLAFKPRFMLLGGDLVLKPTPVRSAEDFRNYQSRIEEIQEIDGFYRSKFRRDLLRFPYLFWLVVRARRHVPILWHLLAGRLTGRKELGWRRAFNVVMTENSRAGTALYRDEEACRLLESLILRFRDVCRAHDKEPILLVLPQPVDLAQLRSGESAPYAAFYRRAARHLRVLDLTEAFAVHANRDALFRNGPLGPHVSPLGNHLIAETLWRELKHLSKMRVAS